MDKKKCFAAAVCILALVWIPACKKKIEPNLVNINQINEDDSNDYTYIFRESIKKQKEERAKHKPNEFKR